MNNNIFQMIGQIKNNPQQFFGNMQGVDMTNPNSIIDYLMRTGKVNQTQYNNAVNMAKQMGFKK
jgi:hypothetical protein